MNAVEATKAGVASGILSMSRMVGGTFGVAVLGALVATLGRSRLDTLLPSLSAANRAQLADGLGSGGVQHGLAPGVVDASHRAFVYALQNGLRLGSAVALVGAVFAWALIANRPAPVPATATALQLDPDVDPGAPAAAESRATAEAVHA
jgi:hypothetical protein